MSGNLTRSEINRRYRARRRGEPVEPIPRQRLHVVEPGQRFGRLIIVRELSVDRYRRFEVICDCGTTRTIRLARLVTPGTKSCGCWVREQAAERAAALKRSHGLRGHPLYSVWNSMMQRCENPADEWYPDYGGRGITVCAEWRDVAAFIAWIEANIGPRPEGRIGRKSAYSLDRIDNDGNYEPGNVRWATWSEQNANRRGSKRDGVDR